MILDRRAVLAGGVATTVLGSRGGAARAAGAIGLQLYTLRVPFAAGPVATLEAVARIGYREVEFGGGGYEAMDHALLRRTLDRVGLRAPSVHVGRAMLTEDFAGAVRMAKTLGAQTVVLPYLDEGERQEIVFERVLASLDPLARRLRGAGLGFAYHNHDFEFTVRSRGVTLFERLLAATDPALVRFELDLYWAAKAGQDLPALTARLGERLWAVHVKDMAADGAMCAVGDGTIDFAAVFRLPALRTVRHRYVENDQAPAPYLPDVARSFRAMRSLMR